MARTVITRFVSDLTGKDIDEGKAVTLRIVRESDPENLITIDANETEVKELLDKGTITKKPGRKGS